MWQLLSDLACDEINARCLFGINIISNLCCCLVISNRFKCILSVTIRTFCLLLSPQKDANDCDAKYVEETRCSILQRFKEHCAYLLYLVSQGCLQIKFHKPISLIRSLRIVQSAEKTWQRRNLVHRQIQKFSWVATTH